MRKVVISVMVLLALAACTNEKKTILKSPCVGTDESPCGPKRYINNA